MGHPISEYIAWIILLIVMGAPVLTGLIQAIREETPINLEPDIDDDDIDDEEMDDD